MTILPSTAVTFTLIAVVVIPLIIPFTHAIGSGATLAVSYASGTVCGVVASQPTQRIVCYRRGQNITVDPDISFSSIAGRREILCGLRSGWYSLLCWDNLVSENSSFVSKRIYFNSTVVLENLSVGGDQICATVVGSGDLNWWRGNDALNWSSGSDQFVSISSGSSFSCGILKGSFRVRCWGNDSVANQIENGFGNSMASIAAGDDF